MVSVFKKVLFSVFAIKQVPIYYCIWQSRQALSLVWAAAAAPARPAGTLNIITVGLTDGASGDMDGAANGKIEIAGAPSDVAIAGVREKGEASNPDPVPHSSGGGGCTMGDPRRPDATLALLLLSAGAMLMRRKWNRAGRRTNQAGSP